MRSPLPRDLSTTVFLALALALAFAAPSAVGQKITRLTSAPRPGNPLAITYASAANDVYVMFVSSPHPGSLAVPGVSGLFLLDPATLVFLYPALVPASGTDTKTLPLPSSPALLGAGFDLQPINLAASLAIEFGVNKVRTTIVSGIGTMTPLAATDASMVTGDLQVQKVSNTTVGAPTLQAVPPSAFQPIRHVGARGWVEGCSATLLATAQNSDIAVFRRDRVGRNVLSRAVQTIVLPNGSDLAILRDRANCRKFTLARIDRSTGDLQLLSGSSVTDSALPCPATTLYCPYTAQFGFSANGSIAACIVRDSSNQGGAGAADRVLLVKTDGTTWTSSGTSVLDVTATATPSPTYDPGTVIVAGPVVFVSGSGRRYWAPLDGSAKLIQIAMPKTGTANTERWAYAESWRVSADGKTVVIPIGGDATNPELEHDLVSFTGIATTGFTVKNLSAFPQATRLETAFGTSSVGPDRLKADLSPDGSRVAFLGGSGTSVDPSRLYVARTDGSGAGTLVPVSAGKFDPQVTFMGSVHFVANDRVLFLAGSTPTTCDWYAFDVAAATFTDVSKTTTGRTTPPFTAGGTTGTVYSRGDFGSVNGRWLYFVRGWDGTVPLPLKNNLVAINTATLALKDITGNDFASGGTAPDIYRGGIDFTTNPWPAYEFQLRRSPDPVSNDAFFVAEKAAGASATVFNHGNVFRFDIENAGTAAQLTNHTGGGLLSAARVISQLTLSPEGKTVAYAQRLGLSQDSSEDVFVVPAAGGTPVQLSVSDPAGQSVCDGSIWFTGRPVDGVAWVVGSGSASIPMVRSQVQWSLITGQNGPLLLSPHPATSPARIFVLLGATNVNL